MKLRLFVFLLALGSFSTFLTAQSPTNNIFIEGPQTLCLGECGTWVATITGGGPQGGVYQWVFQSGGISDPNSFVDTITTSSGILTWCPPFAGLFRISLTIIGPNGTTTVVSQPAVVFVGEALPAFYTASYLVETACEQDTITIFFPQEEPRCIPVCEGSETTVTLLSLFGGFSNGSTFAYQPSPNDPDALGWTVSQGTLASASGQSATVVWGQPGFGSVQANWTTQVLGADVFCQVTISPSLCFEITPRPEARIETAPEADAGTGVLTICEGQTVQFEGVLAAGSASLAWNFGDGATAAGATASHTFTQPGAYEVQLVALSTCACSDTARLTVVVTGNETPFVDCVGTICAGETVTYSANTGCANYVWTVSANGAIISGGGPADNFITIEWLSGPTGQISLDTDGCPDLSACTETAVLQVPILDDNALIEGPPTVCAGQRAVYAITPFEGTEFTWTVSNFGIIESGQGTPGITVLWQDLGFVPSQAQWVRVMYNNCYLDCGGADSLVVNMRPGFFATGAIETCAGGSADFTAFRDNGLPLAVDWSVIDGAGATVWTGGPADNISIPFTFGAGRFTVRATPPAAAVCLPYLDLGIQVYPEPAAVDSITGQRRICPGQSYVYRVPNAAAGDRFEWVVTDGGATTTLVGNPIAYTWGPAGPYAMQVRRLQRPPLNCSSAFTNFAFSSVGSFTIAGPASVCRDETASYTSSLTGDGEYQWSILPATAGTIKGRADATEVDILWHEAGAAQLLLNVCGQTESLNVQINDLPQPIVTAPASVCANSTTTVTTTAAFAAYAWEDTSGMAISTLPNPNLGAGYYRLTATNAQGCVGEALFSIGQHPVGTISISTPDFTIYCLEPPFARLFAPATGAGLSYQWFQDGAPVGANSPSFTATALGAYQLRVTDVNGCEAVSNVISLVINCGGGGGGAPGGGAGCNNPAQTFTIAPGARCETHNFAAIAAGATAVSWDFDDPASGGANFSTAFNPSHTFSAPGFYRVLLTAEYPGGAVCRTIIPDTILAVANFDYAAACSDIAVSFTDLSAYLPLTSITAWEWHFGDPGSGTADTSFLAAPTHIYDTAGVYQARLIVTTAAGCQAEVVKPVTVLPSPVLSFPTPDVSCAATSIAFLLQPDDGISPTWDFGDPAGGSANTSQRSDPFHAYALPGAYSVQLSGFNIYGCPDTFLRSITIQANPLAGSIAPPGPTTLCQGDSVLLTAPAGGTAWAWSTGETTEQLMAREAGLYSVVVTNAEGCTYEAPPSAVDIIPAPEGPIRAVAYDDNGRPIFYVYDSLAVCFGEDVFLETVFRPGFSWLWSTGDVTTNISFTADRNNLLQVGEHIITLRTTDGATGCAVVETFVVTVHPTPNQPILVSLSPQPLCGGTPIDLEVSNVEAGVSYLWSNGGQGAAIQTDAGGSYVAAAINAFGCRALSDPIEVFPGPDISLVPGGCHVRCQPDTLCLPPIPGVVSFQWLLNNAPIPGATAPELITDQSGIYALQMTDGNGCLSTSAPLTLDLLPGFGDIVGNVYFDVNENGLIDAADTLVANVPLLLVYTAGADTVRSTAAGAYGFVGIPADNYTVQVDTLNLPEGWRAYIASVDTVLAGCDQLVTLPWLLYQSCALDTSFTVSICPDEVFTYQGQNLPPGSSQTFTLSTLLGCDSVVTVTVQALSTATGSETLFACPGSTATYQGMALAIGSSTPFTFAGANGCDSVVTVTVQAFSTPTTVLVQSVCAGEAFSYLGFSLLPGADTTFVLADARGCDSLVRVQVSGLPAAALSLALLPSCPNENSGSLTIAPTGGASPFRYALDGVAFSAATFWDNLAPGAYQLSVLDNNDCPSAWPFTIEAQPALAALLPDVTLPCDGAEASLTPEVLSGDDGSLAFVWSDGDFPTPRPLAAPGVYTLRISNSCETLTLQANARLERDADSLSLVYVPNAFSPNDDGVNDKFQFFADPDLVLENISFRVFDRWGALVYQGSQPDSAWAGKVGATAADPALFIWLLEADATLCGRRIRIKRQGEVSLIR